jgi:hypothetical protein
MKLSLKTTFISPIELAICNFIAFRIHFCIFDGFRNAFNTNYFFAFLETNWAMVPVPVYRSYTISLPVNPAKSCYFCIVRMLGLNWFGRRDLALMNFKPSISSRI